MKVTGHRGAKDEWPENTLLGIAKAIESGVEAIEIDIHLSSDGELVVIHDKTLERTTNGNGDIAQMTLKKLRELDAGMGERIPTLREVLDLTIKKNIHLFIEVKVPGVEKELIKIIEEKSAFTFCSVISFDHRFIKLIKSLNSNLHTGCLIVGIPINPERLIQDADASLLVISTSTVDAHVVKVCHDNDIKVAVWNANTKEDFLRMRNIKADFIMTDKPSLICE